MKIEDVNRNITTAIENTKLLLKEKNLEKKAHELLRDIKSFQKITQYHYKNQETSGVSTPIYQEYDALFKTIVSQNDEIILMLSNNRNEEMILYKKVYYALILGITLLILWLTYTLLNFLTKIRHQFEELKNSESELSKQKELYDVVFQKTVNGVLLFDMETQSIIDVNQPAINMLHYNSKEDILNLHPSEISSEFQSDGRRSDEKIEEMIALAFKNGSHVFEWKHIDANGTEFWVEVILTPVKLGSKNLVHAVCVDIVQTKKYIKEIENLNNSLEITVE